MAGLADRVRSLLRRRGVRAVLTSRSLGPYDPATGEASASESESSVLASPPYEERRQAGESGAVESRLRAIVETGVEPAPGGRLGISGRVHGIVAVEPVEDNSGVVAYILDLGDARAG